MILYLITFAFWGLLGIDNYNLYNSNIFASKELETEVINSIESYSQDIYEKIEAYLFLAIIPDLEKLILETSDNKKDLVNAFLYTVLNNSKVKESFILCCGLFEVLVSEFKDNQILFIDVPTDCSIKKDTFDSFFDQYRPFLKYFYQLIEDKELLKGKLLDLFYDEKTPKNFIRGVLKGIRLIDQLKERSFDYYLSSSNQQNVNTYMLMIEKHFNFFEKIFSDWIEYCTNMLYSKSYRKVNYLK